MFCQFPVLSFLSFLPCSFRELFWLVMVRLREILLKAKEDMLTCILLRVRRVIGLLEDTLTKQFGLRRAMPIHRFSIGPRAVILMGTNASTF